MKPFSSLPGRILLADDDLLFRDSLGQRLRHAGYECVCAENANDALQKMEAAEFDVLISDIFMPGNTGLEMVERIAQIAPGLPVILITGNPSTETAIKSVKLAVIGYLLKPPPWDELLGLIDKAIAQHWCYNRIVQARQRWGEWLNRLHDMEVRWRQNPITGDRSDDSPDIQNQYLQLMVDGLRQQLEDLQLLTKHQGDALAHASINEPLLIDAIRQTIEVLELTRHNFKSKRLGALRRDLEVLLRHLGEDIEADKKTEDNSKVLPASAD